MTDMKSVNNASISFPPFISAPVKTYSASDSHTEALNMHHVHDDGAAHRIKRPYICGDCGESVTYSELVRGQTRDDTVLLVSDSELTQIEVDCGKDYEVLHFVHADEVPAMLYGDPYFLEPDDKRSKQATETYETLRVVLEEKNEVGIVKYTNRGKTHLAMLRPERGKLVLQHLTWPDEMRDIDEVAVKPVNVNPEAVKLMGTLVENMTSEFNAEPYVDMYAMGVKDLLDAKEQGVPMSEHQEAVAAEEVSDLLAALERSIRKHPAGKGKKGA
jgi:DNA end-binding protein Ku